MKYVCISLLIMISIANSLPISSIPQLEEIWSENQYIFPYVDDVPESLLPGGATDLIVAGVPTGELAMRLFLIAEMPDGYDVLASGPYQGEYNFAKSFAYWIPERSVLEITFQMPFCARYAGAEYEWAGAELVPVEWLSGDPSMESLQRVDSLLAIGEIEEAGSELGTMFYPGYYYRPGDMAAAFLRACHEKGLEEWESGDPEAAAESFDGMEEASYNLLLGYPWYRAFEDSSDFLDNGLSEYMTIGEFTAIANDYGFFLEQSGNYEKAADVLFGVLTLDPDRIVAYLNLGDALWELADNNYAVMQYRIYMDMMESVNLQDDIPERVNQRVLNYGE